ncbi:hypothetical protein ACH3XW_30925 [Acanthocheilonema viteae]|uniref:Uncharacterized protein n=1 Tax=Acanthocheilonema viteae TaxID=6277 RepID=A0A498SLT9_ACAVI|nr:unnamed protein product [Acanthocheilonema viteae]
MVDVTTEISEKKQTVSKFAGEAFDVGSVRTVFAGASKDNIKRSDRVILLIGSTGSNKSNLIDCMCNYFYGAKFDGIRYKIANEIFDRGSTPIKSITKYVFNATAMPFRPIIIDTPEIANDSEIATKDATACALHDFLIESQHLQINALCLVLKFDEESISKNETIVQETINLFPPYMLPSTIILFSSNDEKPFLPPSIKLVLRHLNLNYNKYYFFNDHFLQPKKGNKEDDEIEKQKARLSWNLSMGELDRFFEQIRYLSPRSIIPDENIEFSGNDMLQRTSNFTQSSTRNIPYERIIPIKLIGEESTNVKTLTALKDWNSSETPVIKRYVYDPGTMTHREYVMKLQNEEKLSGGEYPNIQNFDAVSSKHKPHETLINDIPQENRMIKKQLLSSNENGIGYMHMRSSPPPEYSTETVAVIHQSSNRDREGKTKIKKRIPSVIDMESQQQKTLYPQHSKSAVQRQIARRTSSGSEHSKSHGVPSQQQQSAKNRQIKQIKRLEDGTSSTSNAIQSTASERLNDQEHRNYVITPEMKRSKSPILMRLLMNKRKRCHSTSPTAAQKQSDSSFEQPRALETNVDQSLQSPLRNYGRLVHEYEVEERPQDGTIHLSEESAIAATTPRQNFRTEKAGIGMKSGYGGNEHNQLFDAKQLNLEEGLTPHPYKKDPCIEVAVVNRKKDYSAERKKKLLKLLCFIFCPIICVIAVAVILVILLFVL